jgi:hypothetical protein
MACCGVYELARSDSDAGGSLEVGDVVVVIVVVVLVLVIAPDRMLVPFMPLWDKDRSTSGFATVAHVNEKSRGTRSFEVEVRSSRRDVGISGWGMRIADAYADVVIEELSDDKASMPCEGSCGDDTLREGIQTVTASLWRNRINRSVLALVAVAVAVSRSSRRCWCKASCRIGRMQHPGTLSWDVRQVGFTSYVYRRRAARPGRVQPGGTELLTVDGYGRSSTVQTRRRIQQ